MSIWLDLLTIIKVVTNPTPVHVIFQIQQEEAQVKHVTLTHTHTRWMSFLQTSSLAEKQSKL